MRADSPTRDRWYAVQVLGGQEKATLDLMRGLAGGALADAFVPERDTMRHRAGDWVRQREVLFPGYVLVRTADADALFAQLARVPAFTRLLGGDGGFAPLAHDELALVRALCGGSGVAGVSQGVEEGGQVRILSGPLRDLEGLIVKIDRHKRAAFVSLHMFGRDTLVKLALDIVRKA